MRPKNSFQAYLTLHFIIFIWGFTAVLGALISLKAIDLVWFRLSLALPFLLVWIYYKKYSLRISYKDLGYFILGGLIITLHWISFFKAIKLSNVSVTLITLSTGAFFTSFIEPFFFKRKIVFLEVFLGVLIVGSLYLTFRVSHLHLSGVLWALLAAFLSALFSVINGVFVRKHNGYVLSFYQLSFGVIAISLYYLFREGFPPGFFILSKMDWVYLLLLSVICTGYAFATSIELMKKISPYTVMLSVNLEPVYGILLALLVFGEKEKMNANFYLGSGLILIIIAINSWYKIKHQS